MTRFPRRFPRDRPPIIVRPLSGHKKAFCEILRSNFRHFKDAHTHKKKDFQRERELSVSLFREIFNSVPSGGIERNAKVKSWIRKLRVPRL